MNAAIEPVVESSSREGEEPVKIAPGTGINKLSDRFKEALATTPKEAAAAEKAKPQAEPVEPKVPAAPQPHVKEKPAEKLAEKEAKIPRENFRVLETQRDEFKTKWEQAEARAKEQEAKAAEASGRIPKDYDELKASLAQKDEIVQRFYVEHSPQFKQAFDDKIASGIEDAREIVGAEHADKVADLLALPPSKQRDAAIEELTEGMSAFKQTALVKAFSEVRQLQKARAAELGKAKENFKYLKDVESQQATKTKLARQESLERALKVVGAEAVKESVHFQRIDGNDEHNSSVAENEKMLKEFSTSDLAPEDRARLSKWAVRGMRSAQTDQLKDAMISKLEGELKAIQDANPGARGGGKPGSGGQKPRTAAEKYAEAIEHGGIPAKE